MKKKIAIATLALMPLSATNAFASGQEGIVTATSLNVRSGPSVTNPFIFALKQNERVTILETQNGWYRIKASNGKSGWASSEYIKTDVSQNTQLKDEKVVNVDNLNMRNGASTSYRIITKLKQGTKVELISESNGWSKIKYDGRIGYVASQYLSNETVSEKPYEVQNVSNVREKVVTATSLNVRSGPSTSTNVIGSVKQNKKVQVMEETNGWSKIKYDGRIGYVASQYLSNETVSQKPHEVQNVSNVREKVVTATSLNVRSGPSTSNSVIGSVKQNEKVNVVSEKYGWAEINYSGKEGYLSSSYLKDPTNETNNINAFQQPVTKKTVISTSLNVRSGPSTNTSIIKTLKYNEIIEVISEINGWSKIKCNGNQGYVSNLYIKDLNGKSESINQVIDTNNGASSSVVNGSMVNNINLNYTLSQHINKQVGKSNGNMIASRGFTQASQSDVTYYINPGNFTGSQKGMLQFLRLDSFKEGISANELNGFLNKLRPGTNGTNVFYNQGQAFIDAARKYNIDLTYLVGHSMLETGYGRSTLAQGQVIKSYKGQALPQPVKVYNFFGIGAFDGTANLSGAEAAYKNGWTSIESTIEGSAKWISSNYIHNSRYNQNTLYKMRWSYDYLNHQYATDVNWANAISSVMNKIVGMYDTNSNLVYEVPVHKK